MTTSLSIPGVTVYSRIDLALSRSQLGLMVRTKRGTYYPTVIHQQNRFTESKEIRSLRRKEPWLEPLLLEMIERQREITLDRGIGPSIVAPHLNKRSKT